MFFWIRLRLLGQQPISFSSKGSLVTMSTQIYLKILQIIEGLTCQWSFLLFKSSEHSHQSLAILLDEVELKSDFWIYCFMADQLNNMLQPLPLLSLPCKIPHRDEIWQHGTWRSQTMSSNKRKPVLVEALPLELAMKSFKFFRQRLFLLSFLNRDDLIIAIISEVCLKWLYW